MKTRMYVCEQDCSDNPRLRHYESMNLHIRTDKSLPVNVSTWLPGVEIWVYTTMSRDDAARAIRNIRTNGKGIVRQFRG